MSVDPPPELHVASLCYGGLASAGHLRSLLGLRAAVVSAGLGLRLDLGGGEALASRGRAGALGRFLAGQGSLLLLIDGDVGIDPHAVLHAALSGAPLTRLAPKALLLSRAGARRLAEAAPSPRARLGDVFGASQSTTEGVFACEAAIQAGHYVTDLDALCARWAEIVEAASSDAPAT